MNWLAHTALSCRDVDYQLGNILADPLKGRPWEGASPAVLNGMTMHKAIDAFTDSHEIVAASKARLGDAGLLRGVVLDVIYGHFLAVHWDQYVCVDLDVFLAQFYQDAEAASSQLPETAKQFVQRLVRFRTLSRYGTVQGVADALERIDARLSARVRAKDTTSAYLGVFVRESDGLHSDFEQFFPELICFFQDHRLGSRKDHHLR